MSLASAVFRALPEDERLGSVNRVDILMTAPGGASSGLSRGAIFDMETANQKSVMQPGVLVPARLGIGSWTVLVVLLLLLAGTFAVVYFGWSLANGTDMPASGYVAMAFGVLVSLGVGFGLMALLFYSSRKGYDEPPVLISPGGDGSESETASASEK
jgi:hypothetical protein